jgi:hypothetical protein
VSSIVFLDEAGNLNLELRDEEFPLFALTMLGVEQQYYARTITPAFAELKLKYFGHDAVIFHSRDIRKAQGTFGILTGPNLRQRFMADLTALMRDLDYRWITAVIRKQDHRERYGANAESPYDLALTFCLEGLLPLLEQERQAEVTLVAEAGGHHVTRIWRIAPNPSCGRTTVSYSLGAKQRVSLAVFNVAGQKVSTLADGVRLPGRYSLVWDGTDDNGRSVSAGIYFVKLEADRTRSVKKAVVAY